jgi:hypothetical protein
MQETQMYKDKLKEVNEYNSVLFARLQELEAKCAEESWLKEGKFLLPFCLLNPIISEYTLDWSWFCLIEYKAGEFVPWLSSKCSIIRESLSY